MWRSKLKYFGSKNVIPYFLYYDEYEVNNPLGNHAVEHSIGAVYISFPTLPTEYRSVLENVFPAMFVKSKYIKMFGNTACFNKLVDDMEEPEENDVYLNIGIDIVHVFFVLGGITGDNLGLNSILGFARSFSSNYFCRFCKRHKPETVSDCHEVEVSLRIDENYAADLLKNSCCETGIAAERILNKISFFHAITNYNVGLRSKICMYVLMYLLDEAKLLTLETLNSRKQAFDYERIEIGNLSKPIT